MVDGWDRLVNQCIQYGWVAQDALIKFENNIAWNKTAFIEIDKPDAYLGVFKYTSLPWVQSNHVNSARTKLSTLWRSDTCRKCPFMVYRHTEGVGNLNPEVMVVGEAPGVGNGEIERFDRVLVYGPTSHLIRDVLYSMKLIQNCWFTNLMKCSFPNNRAGKSKEFNECYGYLAEEFELLNPKLIIALGVSVGSFLSNFKDIKCPVIPVMHPSFYLAQNRRPTPDGYATHLRMQLENVI